MLLEVYAISDIRIEKTGEGWLISASSPGGECDKSGMPWLEDYLRRYVVDYPHDIFGRLEWLWDAAERERMNDIQLQEAIDQLSDWIMTTQKVAPTGGVWDGYAPDITEWVALKERSHR